MCTTNRERARHPGRADSQNLTKAIHFMKRSWECLDSGDDLKTAAKRDFDRLGGIVRYSAVETELFWAVSESPWIMTILEMAGR